MNTKNFSYSIPLKPVLASKNHKKNVGSVCFPLVKVQLFTNLPKVNGDLPKKNHTHNTKFSSVYFISHPLPGTLRT